MKRAIFLATAALLVMLVLAPVALAQDTTMMKETTMMGPPKTQAGPTKGGKTGGNIPETGGPAILLPAAALLLGSGVLTYAVLRRR